MNLTDRQSASGVSETDLIHIVIPSDTTDSPWGSSFKVEIGEYKAIFSGTGGDSYWTSGSTGISSIKTINTSGLDALGDYAVAEGYSTTASGNISHAEGNNTTASGYGSHAEGLYSQANGYSSHAEGEMTQANGGNSHSEGAYSQANGSYSHAQGRATLASGDYSHAEGNNTIASGTSSHAGGYYSQANGEASFVHGSVSQVNGNYSIVLGRNITGNTADTTYVDNLNIKSVPVGTPVNSLGIDANGHVIIDSAGGGYWSASTGTNAIVTLNSSNLASGIYAVALGSGTTAGGIASYAEGQTTKAFGNYSHAEGRFTIASGETSHAEGYNTIASGISSHAGGSYSRANGTYSFVHGENSVANGHSSIVLGSNITGNTDYTTYVDGLNIGFVDAGPGTIDIGVNGLGMVVNQASDRRLKENVNTIENALDTVQSLRGVTYNWIDRQAGGDGLRYGFIAQEVQEVVPDLVTQNGEYLGVQYKDVPALLVEAIKQLTAKVNELENIINELKK